MKRFIFAVAVVATCAALADGWKVSAGPAWRARTKTSFSGGSTPPDGVYQTGSFSADGSEWSGDIDELPVRSGGIDTGTKVSDVSDYALRVGRTESIAQGGADDDERMGLSVSIDRAFAEAGPFSFSANLRFAGYWGMENGVRGGYCSYNDYYRFDSVLGDSPDPVLDSVNPDLADGRRDYLAGGAVDTMRTALKSDLYQIGLGPRVSAEAFRWCRPLCWIDVYAGAEALCNIIDNDFDVGGARMSDVNCRLGFGGYVGLTGNLVPHVSVFAQVGYEWVDEDTVSAHGIKAETDYSSLVLSAGLMFRF